MSREQDGLLGRAGLSISELAGLARGLPSEDGGTAGGVIRELALANARGEEALGDEAGDANARHYNPGGGGVPPPTACSRGARGLSRVTDPPERAQAWVISWGRAMVFFFPGACARLRESMPGYRGSGIAQSGR